MQTLNTRFMKPIGGTGRLQEAPSVMRLLFIADPLESFAVYKDSTFSMMREAQSRGYRVHA